MSPPRLAPRSELAGRWIGGGLGILAELTATLREGLPTAEKAERALREATGVSGHGDDGE
jgi:hypothetical protein